LIVNGEEKTLGTISKEIGNQIKQSIDKVDNDAIDIEKHYQEVKALKQPKGKVKEFLDMPLMTLKTEITKCKDVKLLKKIADATIDDNVISLCDQRIKELKH